MLVAVFWDMGHAVFNHYPGGLDGHCFTIQDDHPFIGLTQSGDRFDQFSLAISLDACQSKDLARPYFEGHIMHCVHLAGALDSKMFYLKYNFFWLGYSFFHLEENFTTHHHVGQFFLTGLGWDGFSDDLTPPHHDDTISDFQHLFQLVGDEHDRYALLLENFYNSKEVICLLRGEDSGGFIQDKDIGMTIERF